MSDEMSLLLLTLLLWGVAVVATCVWWVARNVPGSPESKLVCCLGLHDLSPPGRLQCRCQRCDALFVAELRAWRGRRLLVWRRVKGKGLGSTR